MNFLRPFVLLHVNKTEIKNKKNTENMRLLD